MPAAVRSGGLVGGARLAVAYGGGDADLLERAVRHVGVVELTPDTMVAFRGGRPVLDRTLLGPLRDHAADVTFAVHGIGLSIASASGWQGWYLGVLDELFEALDIAWHSDHLGYTHVDGLDVGSMLVPPRTEEALDLICERVELLRARFGCPFLLENVAGLLPDPGGTHSPAGFLNELAARSGCGLLLDVFNLRCDEANHGLDVAAFLAELDLTHVRELHVADGVRRDGFLLDVHCAPTEPATVELARHVLHRAPAVDALTFEVLPHAVAEMGGAEAVAAELTQLSAALAAAATGAAA